MNLGAGRAEFGVPWAIAVVVLVLASSGGSPLPSSIPTYRPISDLKTFTVRPQLDSASSSPVGWSRLLTASAPPEQWATSLAYDPAIGRLVEFGGMTLYYPWYQNSTWVLTGTSWQNESHGAAPPVRIAAQLAYDDADGYLLLFGGCGVVSGYSANCPPDLGDTWTYSDHNWTQVHSTVSPSARQEAGMTFDPADGYVLLFGGNNGSSSLGDTWVFKSGQWQELHPNPSPPAESGGTLAYDPAIGYCVLFGGSAISKSGAVEVFNTTWGFRGGQWFNLTTSVAPSPRDFAHLAFDSASGDAILFGGENAQNVVLNDTWVYEAGTWINVTRLGSAPSARVGFGMDYDPQLGSVVLFGGAGPGGFPFLNDTWLFTAPWNPSFQIQLNVSPVRCGSFAWGSAPEASGTTIVDPMGNYSVSAPLCSNEEFSRWVSTGGVRAFNSTSPTTTIEVSGNGTLEAFYLPAYPVVFGTSPTSCSRVLFDGVIVQSNQAVMVSNGTYNLVAPACEGDSFVSWSVAGLVAVQSSKNASTSLIVSGPGNVTADYSPTSSNVPLVSMFLWLGVGIVFGIVVGVTIGILMARRHTLPAPGSGPEQGERAPPQSPNSKTGSLRP